LRHFSGEYLLIMTSHSSCSTIYRELSVHLGDLEPFLGTKPFLPGMGVVDKMKVVLKQAGELLASEVVAKTLTEVNRKIASSLQNFVVRLRLSLSKADVLIQ
jgi:hypothetical protein